MSATASSLSPSRTAAMPELISGSAEATERTVAPKMTPLIPARLARSLPATSSTTPAIERDDAADRKTVNRPRRRLRDAASASRPGAPARRCLRPGLLPGISTCHAACCRARLMRVDAREPRDAIASEAGLTGPIRVDSGSSAPIRTPETTKTTSSASRTGTSEPTRKLSACSREATASQMTSTIVCTAMPPIRLPAASPRLPFAAAETVIAISGRLPATASRTRRRAPRRARSAGR